MSNSKDYVPHPIDTSSIQNVDQDILELLAKNTHEVWAKQRIEDGWTYGEHKDEIKKTTPLLIPYEELSDEKKQYDRNTAEQALKVMMAAGIPLELSPEIRENLKGMFLTGEEKAVWEQDRQKRELAKQKNEQYARALEKSQSPYVISAYYSDPDWERHGDSSSLYPYSEVLDSAETLEEGLIKLNLAAYEQKFLFSDEWGKDEDFKQQMFTLNQQEPFGGYHILANDFCTLRRDGSFSIEPVTFLYGIPEEFQDRVTALREAHPQLFAMTADEQEAYDWAVTDVRNFQKQQTETLQASGQRFGVFLENDSRLAEFTGLWPEEEQPLLAQEFQISAGDLNTALLVLHKFGAGKLPQESFQETRHWSVCVIQNDPETGDPVLQPVAHFDRQGVQTENKIWRETTSGIQWDDTALLTSSEQEQIPQIQSARPEWFSQSTTRTPVRRNPEREEQVKENRNKQLGEKLTNLREQEDEVPF